MRILELFSGTGSVGKVCKELGWEVISLDIDSKHNPDICIDFMEWDYKTIDDIDIIWSSPDCSVYSMASGNKHFDINRKPKTIKAENSLKLLDKLKDCILYHLLKNPNLIFFIENPRARMRWFNTEMDKHTICYCKYGFDRMKPTDIWTNHYDFVPKMCYNNNMNCNHQKAPRGSKTGTQNSNINERYRIPPNLIKELFSKI